MRDEYDAFVTQTEDRRAHDLEEAAQPKHQRSNKENYRDERDAAEGETCPHICLRTILPQSRVAGEYLSHSRKFSVARRRRNVYAI